MIRTSLKLLLMKVVKQRLSEHKEKSFKEMILRRIRADLKGLSVTAFAAGLALIIFSVASVLTIVAIINQFDISLEQTLLYSAGASLLLSILLLTACALYFKKKMEIYENIEGIKDHLKPSSWLEPLRYQLHVEQVKMKKNLLSKQKYRL